MEAYAIQQILAVLLFSGAVSYDESLDYHGTNKEYWAEYYDAYNEEHNAPFRASTPWMMQHNLMPDQR